MSLIQIIKNGIPKSWLSIDGTFAANSDKLVPSQKAVKTYIASQLGSLADALVFKGVIDASGNPNYPAANAGDTYKISVAGKVGGASGKVVEVNDMVICTQDGTASGDEATVGIYWVALQNNIDGAWTSTALAQINGLTDKSTPVDADTLVVDDSAASNAKKKLTWANVKATLKSYFDTLYQVKLSGASLTAVTVATDDKVIIQDTSDSNNIKTVTAQSIADLASVSAVARFSMFFPIFDAYTAGKLYSTITLDGSVTVANGSWGIGTNATNGGKSALYASWAANNAPAQNIWDSDAEFQFISQLISNTTGNYISYLLFGGNGTAPTQATGAYTVKHMGFILDGTKIYASNADGTTQTTTELTGVTLTATNVYRVVQDSGTNIKFYVNGVLKATHTTNLPSGASSDIAMTVGVHNDSGDSTDRRINYAGATLTFNG